jgi:hypothetical protein
MCIATKFIESRVIREITCNLTYVDTTSARVFTLPKGARLVDWIINVKTAFAGGTTTLDIGTSSDGDYFIDGVAVNAVGKASPSVLYPGYEVTTLGLDIYANVGGSNTAGSVDITLLFSMEQGTPFT